MTGKIDISPPELAIVQGLLKDHLPKGTLAWAFGSRVTWTAKPFSDLDIALEGAAPLPSDVLIDLEEAFEASDLPWKVDVIDLNAVSPEFRAIVERQSVPADWKDVTLSDVSDPSRKITYGIVQPGQLHSEGVPIVRVNNFRGNSLNLTDRLAVSPEIEAKYRRSRPRPGDLLISLVGSIGQLAIAPPEIEGWNLARAVGLVPFANPAVANWSFYSLQSTASQDFMNQRANTTVQTTFNLKDLARIPIQLPLEWEMQRILTILQALDDKIELNRRMNETLEAMARAVFRDWFVDFGPTRRKAAGATDPAAILGGFLTDPTQAPPLAALFPHSFADNGLPEGWSTYRTEELASKIAMGPFGSNIKVSTFVENGVPIISGHHLHGTLMKHGDHKFITEEHADRLKNSNVFEGDIIFTHAGTIGQVSMIGSGKAYKRFVISQRQFYLRPDRTKVSPLFLLMYFKSPEGQHELLANASQVGVPSIARPSSHLKGIEICLPSLGAMSAYESIVGVLFEKLISNEQENQTLAATRDLLLPKLMSGKIRLTGAEGAV
ncbi:MAG: restriction endonuclease subunit S [Roseibium sp.]|uniref:restriction endonuclease subunit S n=1 Tax=Roseibium sp. TaxID=1936156 RepID=UPI003264955A